MNGAQERAVYGLALDDNFTRQQLADFEAALGIAGAAGADDGRKASIRRILAALDEPGALEKALRAAGDGAFELLVRLMDIGPIVAIQALRQQFIGIEAEKLSDAMERLNRFALVAFCPTPFADLLLIQPWAVELLDGAVRSFRQERFRSAAPEAEPAPALQTTLALGLNALRAKPIRITSSDSFHRKDVSTAEAPFAALSAQGREMLLLRALKLSMRLDAARIDAAGLLRVEPLPADEALLAPASALPPRLLSRGAPEGRLECGLLEMLRSRSGELPEGWIPDFHLSCGLDLLGARPLPGGSDEREFVILEALDNLETFGLADRCVREENSWWRITAMGRDLLAEVDDPARTAAPAPAPAGIPDALRAIVQPNLDVLVPLEAPGIVHWRIGSIARLESADHVCRYVIDKDHARETYSRERRSAERELAAIAACARHGIPENILSNLRSWVASAPTVRIHQGTVLVLEDRDDGPGRSALAEAARKLDASEAAPGVYVIGGAARRGKLEALLNRSGLRVEEAGAAPPRPAPGAGSGGEEARERAIEALRNDRQAWSRNLEEVRDSAQPYTRHDVVQFQERLDDPAKDEAAVDIEVFDDEVGAIQAFRLLHSSPELPSLIERAAQLRQIADVVIWNGGEEKTWSLLPERIVRRGSRLYLTGCRPDTGEYRAFPLDEVQKVSFMPR